MAELNGVWRDADNGHPDPIDALRAEVYERKLNALTDRLPVIRGGNKKPVADGETA